MVALEIFQIGTKIGLVVDTTMTTMAKIQKGKKTKRQKGKKAKRQKRQKRQKDKKTKRQKGKMTKRKRQNGLPDFRTRGPAAPTFLVDNSLMDNKWSDQSEELTPECGPNNRLED